MSYVNSNNMYNKAYPYEYMQYAQNNNANNQNINWTDKRRNSYAGNLSLSLKEYNDLVDCYIQSPSESVLAAAWGGVTWGLINNPRFVAHPINSIKAISRVEDMFKPVLNEKHELNKLWKNDKTNSIMREAYAEMHRVFARGETRIPIFRKKYSQETVNELKGIMEKALASGKEKEIAEATEILRSAYVTDTWFGKLFKPLLSLTGSSTPYKTSAEAIEAFKNGSGSEYISGKTAERIARAGKTDVKNLLKSHAGFGAIIGFAAFEFLLGGLSNIKKARKKDKENAQNGIKTNYGSKQLMQTTVKGLGSGLGWGLGEALALFAFAKHGTKIGTKRLPWAGAAFGGTVGLIGGSIGLMLLGRVTKALVGEDIANKISAEEMMHTSEGQKLLLEEVYKKVKHGEASRDAGIALNNVLRQLQIQPVQQTKNMKQSLKTNYLA